MRGQAVSQLYWQHFAVGANTHSGLDATLSTLPRVVSQTVVQNTGKNTSINRYIFRTVAINLNKMRYTANNAFHLQARTSTAVMRRLRT